LASLYEAIERRRTAPAVQEESTQPRASVADRIYRLRERLAQQGRVAWQEICGDTVDEIVVTLLAVLELVRRGEIGIVQPDLFGPIRLEALGQTSVSFGGGAPVGQPELTE
jgi:segregation and condensation protein A